MEAPESAMVMVRLRCALSFVKNPRRDSLLNLLCLLLVSLAHNGLDLNALLGFHIPGFLVVINQHTVQVVELHEFSINLL